MLGFQGVAHLVQCDVLVDPDQPQKKISMRIENRSKAWTLPLRENIAVGTLQTHPGTDRGSCSPKTVPQLRASKRPLQPSQRHGGVNPYPKVDP